MKTIVDTSIWSLALRRKKRQNYPEVIEFEKLIENHQIIMLGTIRQEILSGIKQKEQYLLLKNYLASFKDFSITTDDFEKAAELCNICRNKGIQASNTDFLICAVAVNNNFNIFISDKDFYLLAEHIPIELHEFSAG